MNEEKLLTVLLAPHISEKAMSGDRQYVFKVLRQATKNDIRKAVEQIFEVKVDKVRVVNVKSKSARFGRITGRHKGWKKAYVKLAEGSEISIAGSQT
jgi:large subunit ribosomal protein L23